MNGALLGRGPGHEAEPEDTVTGWGEPHSAQSGWGCRAWVDQRSGLLQSSLVADICAELGNGPELQISICEERQPPVSLIGLGTLSGQSFASHQIRIV